MMPRLVGLRPPVMMPVEVLGDPDLTHAAKLVFAMMWSRMGLDGLCTDSLADLRRTAVMADSTMREALRQLVDAGWLAAIKQPGRATAWCVPGPSINPGPRRKSAPPPPEIGDPRGLVGYSPEADPEPRRNSADPTPEVVDNWPFDDETPPEIGDPPARTCAHTRERAVKNSLLKLEIHAPRGPEGGGALGAAIGRCTPARGRSPSAPLPPHWAPSEETMEKARKQAQEKNLDLGFLLEKFQSNYLRGKGANRRYPDWDVVFLQWVKTEDPQPVDAASAPGGARASGVDAGLLRSRRKFLEIIEANGGDE